MAPFRVISVIKLLILPISVWVFFISLKVPSFLPPYSNIGSNPSRPFNGGVDVILTLPPVGITITVSPSKSAPDKRAATLLLIPIASAGVFPKILRASACLLLTVRIGISNVPP